MSWNLDSNRPIYPQIMERITMDIISGTYPPGSKLPSVRELAQEAGVNPNTMQKSLSELERTGLLYSQRTSGRFITEDLTMIEHTKNTIASEQVKEFLKKMEYIGFTKQATIQLIELDNDDIVTRDVPAYLFTSWAKGNYEFRNTSLSEIVAQLSRWYNVDIYFKNESLKDKRFAGIIFRDEELNFAIEVIERVSNVHFTREGETIYIEDKHE